MTVPLWNEGRIPLDATKALDLKQDPMALSNVPTALQGISLGFVAECLHAGFQFDEDNAHLHEALFESINLLMRLYLAVAYIKPRQVEKMVSLITSDPGELPPIDAKTMALGTNVMFDNPGISKVIVDTKPICVVWMNTTPKLSVASKSATATFSTDFKILTPSLTSNITVDISGGNVSIRAAVSPREVGDEFGYLPVVPLANIDMYRTDILAPEEESKVPEPSKT